MCVFHCRVYDSRIIICVYYCMVLINMCVSGEHGLNLMQVYVCISEYLLEYMHGSSFVCYCMLINMCVCVKNTD